jgi:chemotaxis protein MotB
MAKGKKCPECEVGAPAWVVTFGDLMSLLMTFFVLLLSFATMEKPREVREAMISIQGAFGVMPKNMTLVQINPAPVRMKRMPQKVEDTARELQRELQVLGKAEDIVVEYDATGALKISLPNNVLYESGQSTLLPESFGFLSGISAILGDLPEETVFEVHGHTDNTPLADTTVFRDNKDLSYARADAVMRYISQNGGIPFDRFRAVAHGAGEPVAPNTTPEGRRANRRVEIYIRGLLTDGEIEDMKDRVRELEGG